MLPNNDRLVGEAPAFLATLEAVESIAPLEKPVLIVGERGTGKELIANQIHYLSKRWESGFLEINCASISDSILESELFGHEAGSFTGATRRHHGYFERANHGTLFLDELATTSVRVQEKILRLIEYGQFERVGGSQTLTVDVRIIAATNQDLPSMAENGKFRMDLIDRLAFDVITLPPLRERVEDIPLLAEYFGLNMSEELNQIEFAGFSEEALSVLRTYSWPGNVRELKNVVERAVYRCEEGEPVVEIVLDPFESPFRPKNLDEPTSPGSSVPVLNFPLDMKQAVEKLEFDLLQKGLEEAKFNQKNAAEMLGLTYHQIRHYMKKYKLTS